MLTTFVNTRGVNSVNSFRLDPEIKCTSRMQVKDDKHLKWMQNLSLSVESLSDTEKKQQQKKQNQI